MSDTLTTPVAEGAAPPELAGLADGLRRILGVEGVRTWSGGVDDVTATLGGDDLSATEVAALSFPPRSSLRGVLDAVESVGLAVAWSGLLRNGERDIRRETPVVVVADQRADDVRDLLATGSANLRFDRAAPAAARPERPVRVCIASYEVVGPTKNGGIGTANTSLAELLGAAGHEVTLLYTGWDRLDDTIRARWKHHYEQRNVDFRDLGGELELEVDSPHFNQVRAYELYRWLETSDREAAWDVVHVPECQGHGYYALLARRLGLAFEDCTFVVGTHSPTRWVYEANRWVLENAHRLIDDFLERRCVELADVVVSPSAYLLAWMEAHGWNLPERRFVQHYATSGAVTRTSSGDRPAPAVDERELVASLPDGPGAQAARELGYEGTRQAASVPLPAPRDESPAGVDEVVFFGRLETRKGLETFCDALDILADATDPPDFRICFMGSETPIQGVPARAYLRDRGREWPWPVRVDVGRNQLEAVAYIREPGRLAVMPSPVDNSPNTVLEALGLGIPFITSRGGGIPELIAPLDLEHATFEPTDERVRRVDVADPCGHVPDLSAHSLASTLRQATVDRAAPRPRFAVDPRANERVHVEWHERLVAARAGGRREAGEPPAVTARVSVCLDAGDEPELLDRARRSFEQQDDVDVELIAGIAAASPATADADRLGAAGWRVVEGDDAAAAASASGEWLFLCDAASTATPRLLSTLLRAAASAGADVVTTAAAYPSGGDGRWRGNVPLGDAAIVGLYYDCFGAGGALISRAAFERLDGFEVDGPPAVRRRDLLCRAALAGLCFAVVPEPVLSYDHEAAQRRSLPPIETMLRALRPYQRALPGAFADLPGLAVSASLAPSGPVGDPDQEALLHGLQERVNTVVTSKSWRMTEPLRWAMERMRKPS